MVYSVNRDSNKKQYIERDNFLLVDDDEIMRLDINPEHINYRMGALFETICGMLGFNDMESELFYIATYKKELCTSFLKMSAATGKMFKRHPRSYYPYYIKMRKRGILFNSEDGIVLGKQFDISQFDKAKYIVFKIN